MTPTQDITTSDPDGTVAVPRWHHRLRITYGIRLPRVLLLVIVLLGIAIRAYHLSDRSIWFDEASSWRTTQFGFREMLSRVGRNSHLPLYFVLLKVWTSVFGDSLFAMRGLNALLAGVTIVGVYLFVTEAFRPSNGGLDRGARADAQWMGLFAAALVAVSIRQILATWDARMYAIGTALTAFSAWTLIRALRCEGAKRGSWILHAIVTTLLAYTHPFALLTVVAELLFLAGYFLYLGRDDIRKLSHNRQFRACIGAYLVVGALWALWLPTMVKQVARVEDHFWTAPLTGHDILHRCYEMFWEGWTSYQMDFASAVVCGAIMIGLVVKGTRGSWLTASLAVTPFGVGALASCLGSNVFLSRYLAFAQIFLLVAIAAIVGRVNDRAIRNWLAATILFCAGVGCWDSWFALDLAEYPGMKGAVEYIQARRGPEDRVILSSSWLYFPALYHCRGRIECRVYSDGLPFDDHQGGPAAIDTDVISDEQLRGLTGGHVWTIHRSGSSDEVVSPANWKFLGKDIFKESSGFRGELEVSEYDVLIVADP